MAVKEKLYECLVCKHETDTPNKLQRILTMGGSKQNMDIEVCPNCGEYIFKRDLK